jgi:quercetin dioxygenase-like cupin family protein
VSLPARRIVTGHTPDGKATVSIEDTLTGTSGRSNVRLANIWTTVEFGPNNAKRVHRTDSVDYAVVMSGEIDMELEPGGEVVHLKAGDVLVQRGTIHNWINRFDEPCAIAFILIDAKPVEVGGKVLNAQG